MLPPIHIHSHVLSIQTLAIPLLKFHVISTFLRDKRKLVPQNTNSTQNDLTNQLILSPSLHRLRYAAHKYFLLLKPLSPTTNNEGVVPASTATIPDKLEPRDEKCTFTINFCNSLAFLSFSASICSGVGVLFLKRRCSGITGIWARSRLGGSFACEFKKKS